MNPWFPTIRSLASDEVEMPEPTDIELQEVLHALNQTETLSLGDADDLLMYWEPTPTGLQAIIWPVVTHRHNHACGRA